MSPDRPELPTYDCLVLSGGGAKGAYGAGVAKALWEFRSLTKVDTKLCVIGTSAGALNAAVLATAEADDLVSFWTAATNRKILGVWIENPLVRGPMIAAWRVLRRSGPYSIYPNDALRRFVSQRISYTDQDSHPRPLILAATNYTTAKLAGFYSSPLVGTLKEWECKNLPPEDRRLQHLMGIKTPQGFFDALLASSAIPVAFPPLKIDGSLYIDGGVGNNTPTREAAYFLRRLAQSKLGVAGEVFCVTQDPARTLDGSARTGFGDILRRSWDVYHTVHTRPIVDAWRRINGDVKKQVEKLGNVKKAISGMPLDVATAEQVGRLIDDQLQPKQQDFSITFIEPSTPLGETLDFSAEEIKGSMVRGYTDFVKTMYDGKRLTEPQRATLDQLSIIKS
jgi:predicted acylesterase/phospholipase RssA